jgi:anti-sigma factor ChrR (cupin superfamily)
MTRERRFDRPSEAPELIAPLLEGIAPAAMDVGRKAALRERILSRVAHGEHAAAPQMELVRADEGEWVKLLPQVYLKRLNVDRVRKTQTALWRLDPGAVLPEHDHGQPEECLILDGSLLWDGATYGKGDYLLAPVGLHHTPMTSPNGALVLIRGELTPELSAIL